MKCFSIVNERYIYTSYSTSKALSRIVLRLKILSLVPIFGLNTLFRILISWSILVAILTCIVFSNNLVTWLIRLMVPNAEHFCAFDFLGIGIKIDSFISVGI